MRKFIGIGFMLLHIVRSAGLCSEPPVEKTAFEERFETSESINIFSMDGYYVWSGSVMKDITGLYHMFAARWPEAKGFNSWMTHAEIIRAVSQQPEGPFQYVQTLASLKAQDWASQTVNNPHIFEFHGMYYLYYTGASCHVSDPRPLEEDRELHKQCRYAQRIGVARSDSLEGPWIPSAENPILSPRPEEWDSTFVNNPAVYVAQDGKILMLYKSSLRENYYTLRLGIAIADTPEGPFSSRSQQPLISHNFEDPVVWFEHERYWLIVKDMTQNYTGTRGGTVLFHSRDGINWNFSNFSVAYLPRIFWDNSIEQLKRMEKPQVLVENGELKCIYTAIMPPGVDESSNLARCQ